MQQFAQALMLHTGLGRYPEDVDAGIRGRLLPGAPWIDVVVRRGRMLWDTMPYDIILRTVMGRHRLSGD